MDNEYQVKGEASKNLGGAATGIWETLRFQPPDNIYPGRDF
jgi:hypothetical protein